MTTCKEKLERISDIIEEPEEEDCYFRFYNNVKVPVLTILMPAIRSAFEDIAHLKLSMREDFDTQSVKIDITLTEKNKA